jgi:tetratricopeptide (TPR) repeat protein
MDLHDFDGSGLYFDEPQSAEVAECMRLASSGYAQGRAEQPLLQALALAPNDLGVLVGLYRFYFYQHRFTEALGIAARALPYVGSRLALPTSWRELRPAHLAQVDARDVGLLRFYLLVLKGAAYLCLRIGHFEQGKAMLNKLVELDAHDRLGARQLLSVLAANNADVLPFPAVAQLRSRS